MQFNGADIGGKEVKPVSIRLEGDQFLASKYIGRARVELGNLKAAMAINSLMQLSDKIEFIDSYTEAHEKGILKTTFNVLILVESLKGLSDIDSITINVGQVQKSHELKLGKSRVLGYAINVDNIGYTGFMIINNPSGYKFKTTPFASVDGSFDFDGFPYHNTKLLPKDGTDEHISALVTNYKRIYENKAISTDTGTFTPFPKLYPDVASADCSFGQLNSDAAPTVQVNTLWHWGMGGTTDPFLGGLDSEGSYYENVPIPGAHNSISFITCLNENKYFISHSDVDAYNAAMLSGITSYVSTQTALYNEMWSDITTQANAQYHYDFKFISIGKDKQCMTMDNSSLDFVQGNPVIIANNPDVTPTEIWNGIGSRTASACFVMPSKAEKENFTLDYNNGKYLVHNLGPGVASAPMGAEKGITIEFDQGNEWDKSAEKLGFDIKPEFGVHHVDIFYARDSSGVVQPELKPEDKLVLWFLVESDLFGMQLFKVKYNLADYSGTDLDITINMTSFENLVNAGQIYHIKKL